MNQVTSMAAAMILSVAAGTAYAERVSLNFERPSADATTEPASASAEKAAEPAVTSSLRFLDKGWWGWSVGGGVAFNSESTDTNAVLTFHTFIADDFEFNFGLGGWYYAQDEDGDDNEKAEDALGINPAFGFRWHFLSTRNSEKADDRRWSVYADVGIGMVFTDEDVPPGGTKYNFTPRAGVGATFALGDEGVRLDVGVRWAHVSNASTSGTDDNPSRDSPMVYVGVMVPF